MSNNLHGRCGFRVSDFIRRYPDVRNIAATLDEREKWVTRMFADHGKDFLVSHQVTVDEMGLTRKQNTKAWSMSGWMPSEFCPESPVHITLILAFSPVMGVVYSEIVEGSVNGKDFLNFIKAPLVELAKQSEKRIQAGEKPKPKPTLILVDNARIHHSKIIKEHMNLAIVEKIATLEFLPRYSPFLSIFEEFFAMTKSRALRVQTGLHGTLDNDRAAMKETLIKQIKSITHESIIRFTVHASNFFEHVLKKEPVFKVNMYEDSHLGDDELFCPKLTDDLEKTILKYLPKDRTPYTARILLQTFLVRMRDHFGDTERGTSMYKVFLNTLVAISWNAFAGDIAVKSRDAIKLHQEKYNASNIELRYLTQ